MSITRTGAMGGTTAVYVAVLALTAPDWHLAANVFLVLLMVEAIGFVALYALRSNWRSTAAGRAVMGLIACIATICALGTVNLALGDYPWRPFVRVTAFAAVGLTLMNLLLALISAQRSGNAEED